MGELNRELLGSRATGASARGLEVVEIKIGPIFLQDLSNRNERSLSHFAAICLRCNLPRNLARNWIDKPQRSFQNPLP